MIWRDEGSKRPNELASSGIKRGIAPRLVYGFRVGGAGVVLRLGWVKGVWVKGEVGDRVVSVWVSGGRVRVRVRALG